jgi:MinD-like ATPase involved in chromosome partitioning or flagellar assembly
LRGKSISIHSSRGGTGKTLLATNLAVLLARKGLKVALLDVDLRAPSLFGVFSKVVSLPVNCWLNDYLDGRCQAADVVVDVSMGLGLPGKLLVGFANPNVEVIRSMVERSRAWEVATVRRLFLLRSKLFGELGVDYCFLDTSPGVQYTSVNATVSSDLAIVVTTLDSLDLTSTKDMLHELYDAFEKKTVVLINKVFPEARALDVEGKNGVVGRVEQVLGRPVLGAIPCYCDVLQTDRSVILAIDRTDHPFVRDLEAIAAKLEELT